MLKSKPSAATKGSRERFRAVSGRNQLIGRITEVRLSGLLAKVVLQIGDQKITSIIPPTQPARCSCEKARLSEAKVRSLRSEYDAAIRLAVLRQRHA